LLSQLVRNVTPGIRAGSENDTLALKFMYASAVTASGFTEPDPTGRAVFARAHGLLEKLLIHGRMEHAARLRSSLEQLQSMGAAQQARYLTVLLDLSEDVLGATLQDNAARVGEAALAAASPVFGLAVSSDDELGDWLDEFDDEGSDDGDDTELTLADLQPAQQPAPETNLLLPLPTVGSVGSLLPPGGNALLPAAAAADAHSDDILPASAAAKPAVSLPEFEQACVRALLLCYLDDADSPHAQGLLRYAPSHTRCPVFMAVVTALLESAASPAARSGHDTATLLNEVGDGRAAVQQLATSASRFLDECAPSAAHMHLSVAASSVADAAPTRSLVCSGNNHAPLAPADATATSSPLASIAYLPPACCEAARCYLNVVQEWLPRANKLNDVSFLCRRVLGLLQPTIQLPPVSSATAVLAAPALRGDATQLVAVALQTAAARGTAETAECACDALGAAAVPLAALPLYGSCARALASSLLEAVTELRSMVADVLGMAAEASAGRRESTTTGAIGLPSDFSAAQVPSRSWHEEAVAAAATDAPAAAKPLKIAKVVAWLSSLSPCIDSLHRTCTLVFSAPRSDAALLLRSADAGGRGAVSAFGTEVEPFVLRVVERLATAPAALAARAIDATYDSMLALQLSALPAVDSGTTRDCGSTRRLPSAPRQLDVAGRTWQRCVAAFLHEVDGFLNASLLGERAGGFAAGATGADGGCVAASDLALTSTRWQEAVAAPWLRWARVLAGGSAGAGRGSSAAHAGRQPTSLADLLDASGAPGRGPQSNAGASPVRSPAQPCSHVRQSRVVAIPHAWHLSPDAELRLDARFVPRCLRRDDDAPAGVAGGSLLQLSLRVRRTRAQLHAFDRYLATASLLPRSPLSLLHRALMTGGGGWSEAAFTMALLQPLGAAGSSGQHGALPSFTARVAARARLLQGFATADSAPGAGSCVSQLLQVFLSAMGTGTGGAARHEPRNALLWCLRPVADRSASPPPGAGVESRLGAAVTPARTRGPTRRTLETGIQPTAETGADAAPLPARQRLLLTDAAWDADSNPGTGVAPATLRHAADRSQAGAGVLEHGATRVTSTAAKHAADRSQAGAGVSEHGATRVTSTAAKPVIGRGYQPLPGVRPSAWWSIDAQVDVKKEKDAAAAAAASAGGASADASSSAVVLLSDQNPWLHGSLAGRQGKRRQRRRGGRMGGRPSRRRGPTLDVIVEADEEQEEDDDSSDDASASKGSSDSDADTIESLDDAPHQQASSLAKPEDSDQRAAEQREQIQEAPALAASAAEQTVPAAAPVAPPAVDDAQAPTQHAPAERPTAATAHAEATLAAGGLATTLDAQQLVHRQLQARNRETRAEAASRSERSVTHRPQLAPTQVLHGATGASTVAEAVSSAQAGPAVEGSASEPAWAAAPGAWEALGLGYASEWAGVQEALSEHTTPPSQEPRESERDGGTDTVTAVAMQSRDRTPVTSRTHTLFGEPPGKPAVAAPATAGSSLAPVPLSDPFAFQRVLEGLCRQLTRSQRLLGRSLQSALYSDLRLLDHLWSLRAVFLLEQGQTMALFTRRVFTALNAGAAAFGRQRAERAAARGAAASTGSLATRAAVAAAEQRDADSAAQQLRSSAALTRWLQTALETPGPHLASPRAAGSGLALAASSGRRGHSSPAAAAAHPRAAAPPDFVGAAGVAEGRDSDPPVSDYAGHLDPAAFSAAFVGYGATRPEELLQGGIELRYAPPPPLADSVLHPRLLAQYARACGFLLRLKRAVFELEALTNDSRRADEDVARALRPLRGSLPPELAAALRAAHSLQCWRRSVLQFAHSLHGHLLHAALAAPWRELLAALRRCDTLEQVTAAHAAYLRQVARRCFLLPDQRRAAAAIAWLLAAAERFAAGCAEFYDGLQDAVGRVVEAMAQVRAAEAFLAGSGGDGSSRAAGSTAAAGAKAGAAAAGTARGAALRSAASAATARGGAGVSQLLSSTSSTSRSSAGPDPSASATGGSASGDDDDDDRRSVVSTGSRMSRASLASVRSRVDMSRPSTRTLHAAPEAADPAVLETAALACAALPRLLGRIQEVYGAFSERVAVLVRTAQASATSRLAEVEGDATATLLDVAGWLDYNGFYSASHAREGTRLSPQRASGT